MVLLNLFFPYLARTFIIYKHKSEVLETFSEVELNDINVFYLFSDLTFNF